MKKILYILPFIASAAFAQESTTDEAYVNPSVACVSGDINWSAIEWTDAEGVARTSPITSSLSFKISYALTREESFLCLIASVG